MNARSPEGIDSKRALQIVLSRIRMSRGTADELTAALYFPPVPEPNDSVDALRAALMAIEENARGVDRFPRAALLTRLTVSAEIARNALTGCPHDHMTRLMIAELLNRAQYMPPETKDLYEKTANRLAEVMHRAEGGDE